MFLQHEIILLFSKDAYIDQKDDQDIFKVTKDLYFR